MQFCNLEAIILQNFKFLEQSMSTVFQFTSEQLPSLEQAGGKALALIQMNHAGMPVPPGFVLIVDFFTPWLDTLKQIGRAHV